MAEFRHDPADHGDADGNAHANGNGDTCAEQFAEPPDLSFICPTCSLQFAVAEMPENGLLKCPECGAEFFATAEESDEDRAERERMELEQQVKEDRLGDIRHNKVLLERRSLYRTRTYFVIGMGLCIAWSMQLMFFSARRAIIEHQGLSLRVCLYLATIVVMLFLAYLCLRKIYAINAEASKPVQHEITKPPDFSTLSDGSQLLDKAAKNLEKLGGGREI
jgi:hypothetical protein